MTHATGTPSQRLLCLAVCDQSCKTCTGPTNQDCSQCEVGWERKGEACLGEVRGGQGWAGMWSVGESRGVKKGRAVGALSLLYQFWGHPVSVLGALSEAQGSQRGVLGSNLPLWPSLRPLFWVCAAPGPHPALSSRTSPASLSCRVSVCPESHHGPSLSHQIHPTHPRSCCLSPRGSYSKWSRVTPSPPRNGAVWVALPQ